MNLELNDLERNTLIRALESYLSELRGEIASGVKHDWKTEMKKDEGALGTVLEKLKK